MNDETISPARRRILALLALTPTGLGAESLALRLGLEESTIRRGTRYLAGLGLIERQKRKGYIMSHHITQAGRDYLAREGGQS